MRNLEVIGEAAKGLSSELRARQPGIAWKSVVGLRDRLIHDYPGVDFEIVWRVVVHDLPALRKALDGELGELR